MIKADLKQAIRQAEPTTKAARLRGVIPDIEQRLTEGVQLAAIHKALTDAGFELTFQTLKTYLYRYRKKQSKTAGRQTEQSGPQTVNATAPAISGKSVSYETDSPEAPTSREPISMQELDRTMKPDPAKQAKDIACYERLAKEKWRKHN